MAKFEIQVERILTLSATFTVSAKNEEAAEAKAQEMLDDEKLGLLEWKVVKGKKGIEWEEVGCEDGLVSVDEV